MAGRALSILVAGGYDLKDPETLARPLDETSAYQVRLDAGLAAFLEALGGEIVQRGHTLLSGCRTDLDARVARGAAKRLTEADATAREICDRIVSYVNVGMEPAHDVGSIRQSELADWELGGRDLNPPEIIRDADAIILIGGFRGTFRAANWARIERKPLVPIALFGGAAEDICLYEAKRVTTLYSGNVTQSEYEAVLKSLSRDWERRAADTVDLAERLATSRDVFVIMSFKKTPEYKDVRRSIENACREHGFIARRGDDGNDLRRIVPEIVHGIRSCAFVVADVTEERPNVYWEVGLATGMDKDILVVAKKGTQLPFDINDVPVIFWESFSDFEEELAGAVERLAMCRSRS